MRSSSHLVLLPTYNTGPRVVEVVRAVLHAWQPVLVVVDGSTDGTDRLLLALAAVEPDLTVMVLPRNAGKGAAVLAGCAAAQARGFTHALVMDADGQHPVESIVPFMAASQREPRAMVLGRPVFPANIPAERLHGRKLSIGLVHFELFGDGVADPLFGFRVYPLASLLAALGARSGGRRYDFDTEAAVRLAWAGVPPRNLSAPVRYFSVSEGGVSHFHYLRDNVTLVWLHVRLIAELLLWRWPALLRHRRAWRIAGFVAALAVAPAFAPVRAFAAAAEAPAELPPLDPAAPEWRELAESFAHRPDATADFLERRTFPFRREALELRGEARVSTTHGLSLHYTLPEERIVIFDAQGMLVRSGKGEQVPPEDPRAAAANEALRRVLRFDFGALAGDFELRGRREGERWTVVLVPRTDALRRSIGRIEVAGDATAVRQIELRRTARYGVSISIAAARPPAPFGPDELKKYFR